VLRQLGAQVKRIRLNQGLTQTEVADAAGITYKHLGRIELAQSEAGADMLVRIAKALGVTVGDLFEAITPNAAGRRRRARV
jgi:transcriptional regulator with XRE-family HTH domain